MSLFNADLEDSNRQTPLSWAAKNGYTEVVKQLLGSGTDITAGNNNGWTPLPLSSKRGDGAIVQLLLGHPTMSTNSIEATRRISLSIAAHAGHEGVVRLPLQTDKMDVNIRDKYGRTPLICSTRSTNLAVLQLLIDTGADINAEDGRGLTALQYAVFSFNLAAERLLVQHEALVPQDFFGFQVLFNKSLDTTI